MAKKRRIVKNPDGGIAPERVEKKKAAPPNALPRRGPNPQEMLPGHNKKGSRSPPQERQPEERLTTAAWLRAFLHRYLPGRLLRVFRLGAPGFYETAATTRGADQDLPPGPVEEKKETIVIRPALLYGAPLHNSARHQWNQRESTQLLDPGRPTINQILKDDRTTVDAFQIQGNHQQYQLMRQNAKSITLDMDICSVCYIEKTNRRSNPQRIRNNNMESHFDHLHFDHRGKVRCRHCEAMFLTRHLEWHTLHCHP